MTFADFEINFARYTALGDSILFLNDSVFSLASIDFHSDEFLKLTENCHLLALSDHLSARNIRQNITASIQLIDYQQFVVCAADACKVISW